MIRTMNYEVQVNKVDTVLHIKKTIQGMARRLDCNYERNTDVYYRPYQVYYFSGDAARRDQDGHYYITGHVDDAINVKGVSIGPNEIEDDIVRVKGIPSFVDCLSQIETSVILE